MRNFISIFIFLLTGCSYCTSQESTNKIAEDVVIDSLVVEKSDRTLSIFSNKKKIKEYKIGLGHTPTGKKQFEGDGKTPEGLYFIDAKSAVSKYHKNLNISYPNAEDVKYAKSIGKSAGGDIKIHGLPNAFNPKTYIVSDWTLGCIALSNEEIDELYQHIKLGSPILILP